MAVQGSVPQLDEDWRFEDGKVIFQQHKVVRSCRRLTLLASFSAHTHHPVAGVVRSPPELVARGDDLDHEADPPQVFADRLDVP
jgi:hypothetical protein